MRESNERGRKKLVEKRESDKRERKKMLGKRVQRVRFFF